MVCPCADGVLDMGDRDEERSVALERQAVRETERQPALGGIGEGFDVLSQASGDLRTAILALPYGTGSALYEEPGYFRNVRTAAVAFDFLVYHLDPRPGERLLDVGADLTWATSRLARRGLECVAVDINHHLSVGRLFAQHYGAEYDLVRADMSRVSFKPATFDIVIAIAAIHHAARLETAIANLARVLRPGGRLGFVEPYCANEEAKAAFGRSQIEAGISEQTYLLGEWHAACVRSGLRVRTLRVADSFAAVYEKRAGGEAALFGRFYRGRLNLQAGPPAVVEAGSVFPIDIVLRNDSNGVWCSDSQFPVYASYHLSRRDASGDVVVAFDNPRTRLARELAPGEVMSLRMEVNAPAEPGSYVAEIDLVHENVSWFAAGGFSPGVLAFQVR
jgi:SAM-dependent methyltransferase